MSEKGGLTIVHHSDGTVQIDLDESDPGGSFDFYVDAFRSQFFTFMNEVEESQVAWNMESAKTGRSEPFPWPHWIGDAFEDAIRQMDDEDLRAYYRASDDPKMQLLYLEYMLNAAEFANSMSSLMHSLMKKDAHGAATFAFAAAKGGALLNTDLLTRKAQRIKLMHKSTRVTNKDRSAVVALNAELMGQFPKETPRFREIAARLDMQDGRVRYILKGPRRKA